MAQAPERRSGGPARAKRKRDNREITRLVVFGLALVLLIAFVDRQLDDGQGRLRRSSTPRPA